MARFSDDRPPEVVPLFGDSISLPFPWGFRSRARIICFSSNALSVRPLMLELDWAVRRLLSRLSRDALDWPGRLKATTRGPRSAEEAEVIPTSESNRVSDEVGQETPE